MGAGRARGPHGRRERHRTDRSADAAFAARLAIATAIALGAMVAAAPGRAAAADGAAATVDELHASMLAVMRDAGRLDYPQRFDRLAPALDRAYDFDFMARKSVGRGFDALDAETQKRWLALFRTYTIANYAGRFGAYHDQRFETLGEEPGGQETTIVRTRLIDPGAESVDLNYRLRRTASGWRVVDVYLKGTVSELALRRADFGATLDRSGYDALAQSLEGKIADLAAGKVK